jgi:hypothetical protein
VGAGAAQRSTLGCNNDDGAVYRMQVYVCVAIKVLDPSHECRCCTIMTSEGDPVSLAAIFHRGGERREIDPDTVSAFSIGG